MTIIPIVVACMIAVACLVGLFFVTKGLICLLRRNPRSGLAYIIVGTLLFVLVAIAIPSFVKARNTSNQQACINNLRIIDERTNRFDTDKTDEHLKHQGETNPNDFLKKLRDGQQ
jgi:hypothetical protein